MLGYWNDPAATAAKHPRRTGCSPATSAPQDEDGYLWFEGRDDDVISSGGYRIGPAEIEECIAAPPCRADGRGGRQPRQGARRGRQGVHPACATTSTPSPALAEEIQLSVRDRLAAYQYPREIEFVDELPMTATGKLRRAELRARERQRKS